MAFIPSSIDTPGEFSCMACRRRIQIETSFVHLTPPPVSSTNELRQPQRIFRPLQAVDRCVKPRRVNIRSTSQRCATHEVSVSDSSCQFVQWEKDAPHYGSLKPGSGASSPSRVLVSSAIDKLGVISFAHKAFEEISVENQFDLPLCCSCWAAHNENLRAEVLELQKQINTLMETCFDDDCTFAPISAGSEILLLQTDGATLASSSIDDLEAQITEAKGQLVQLEAEWTSVSAQEDEVAMLEQQLGVDLAALQSQEDLHNDITTMNQNRDARYSSALRMFGSHGILARVYQFQLDGAVAIINGLRVGKVQSKASMSTSSIIDDKEINGGCGYLIGIVAQLSAKLSIPLQGVVLNLNGSQSTITTMKNGSSSSKTELDFYIKTGIFVWRTFGQAWVVFANCVKLLATFYTSGKGGSSPPPDGEALESALTVLKEVRIEGEVVGGCNVKYGDATDEQWTKAVRNICLILQACIELEDLLRT